MTKGREVDRSNQFEPPSVSVDPATTNMGANPDNHFEEIKTLIKNLETKMTSEFDSLRSVANDNKVKVEVLEERVQKLEDMLEYKVARSCKYNLLFYGSCKKIRQILIEKIQN